MQSDNPFERLFLDASQFRTITPALVERQADLLESFWRQKLTLLSQGAAKDQIVSKYGGGNELLVRRYPSAIQSARDALRDPTAIVAAGERLDRKRFEQGCAKLEETFRLAIADGELVPAESRYLLGGAESAGLSMEEARADLLRRLRTGGFQPLLSQRGEHTRASDPLAQTWTLKRDTIADVAHITAPTPESPQEPPPGVTPVPSMPWAVVVGVVFVVALAVVGWSLYRPGSAPNGALGPNSDSALTPSTARPPSAGPPPTPSTKRTPTTEGRSKPASELSERSVPPTRERLGRRSSALPSEESPPVAADTLPPLTVPAGTGSRTRPAEPLPAPPPIDAEPAGEKTSAPAAPSPLPVVEPNAPPPLTADPSSTPAAPPEPARYSGPRVGTLNCAGPPVVQNGEVVFRNLPAVKLVLAYDSNTWEARLTPGEGNTQRLILRNKKPGLQRSCVVTWVVAPQ